MLNTQKHWTISEIISEGCIEHNHEIFGLNLFLFQHFEISLKFSDILLFVFEIKCRWYIEGDVDFN